MAEAPAVVLDTNLYIALAAGRLPPIADEILDGGVVFHCSVALAELTTGVAQSSPGHPAAEPTCRFYLGLMSAIPAERILTPDHPTWLDAGLLAGTLARTQGLQPVQRKEFLNDALIYLTAAKAGLPVLTADWRDYDLLAQLAPEGGVIPC